MTRISYLSDHNHPGTDTGSGYTQHHSWVVSTNQNARLGEIDQWEAWIWLIVTFRCRENEDVIVSALSTWLSFISLKSTATPAYLHEYKIKHFILNSCSALSQNIPQTASQLRLTLTIDSEHKQSVILISGKTDIECYSIIWEIAQSPTVKNEIKPGRIDAK